ncbi:substrate-binding periplasmic protein [Aestuariispira insulae]|nr:transporter substrate-binding domain-containing protein [Aestuariispira insulae]
MMMSVGRAADIVIANDDAWPPFSHADQPGQGMANMLVIAAFQASGREAEIRLLPWSRALVSARLHKVDGVAAAFRTPEREEVYLYSDSFWEVRGVLLVQAQFPLVRYEYWDELKGFSIGVIQDNAAPLGFLEADLDFRSAPTRVSNLRKLAFGRVDMIYDVELPMFNTLDEIGLERSDFRVLEPPVGRNRLHLIVAKDHPEGAGIIQAFNMGLQRIRENGTYSNIAKRFQLPVVSPID